MWREEAAGCAAHRRHRLLHNSTRAADPPTLEIFDHGELSLSDGLPVLSFGIGFDVLQFFLRVFKVREERLSFHENECKSICSSEKRWLLHLKIFFFPFRDRMDQPVSKLNM